MDYHKILSYPDKAPIEVNHMVDYDFYLGVRKLLDTVSFIIKPGTCTTITYLGGCTTTTMAKAYLTNDPIW